MRRFAKGVSKPDDPRLQVGTVFADHMLRDRVANGGTDRAAISEDLEYIEQAAKQVSRLLWIWLAANDQSASYQGSSHHRECSRLTQWSVLSSGYRAVLALRDKCS